MGESPSTLDVLADGVLTSYLVIGELRGSVISGMIDFSGLNMITFDQTLDSVERILEHLKSVAELEGMLEHVKDNLHDFSDMLEYAHQREFKSTDEALEYIDKILLPRLQGIIDALESGTSDHMKKLTTATDHTQRLAANLELVTGESADSIAQ